MKNVVMGAVLACGLGVLPGARARDIPVYREYTQEIVFYDEEGNLAGYGAAAPDVLALRALRDAKAQEGMMGKETLLEVSFGSGASFFDSGMPVAGKLSPPPGDGGDGRKQKNEPGRNWLVNSISLPSLGQTPDSAAVSAISADSSPSGWGWLADELSGSPADSKGGRFETGQQGDDLSLRSSMDVPPGFGEKSLDAGGESAQAERNQPNPTAGDRVDANTWNAPGGDRAATPDRTAPGAVAEMGQTRRTIGGYSAAAKPDFSALRESFGTGASYAGAAATESKPVLGLPTDWNAASRAGSAFSWNAGGSSLSPLGGSGIARPEPVGMSAGASGPRSWQGAWKAQRGLSEGIPSRFGVPADSVPAPVVPSASRDVPARSLPSSGGYKPGWY